MVENEKKRSQDRLEARQKRDKYWMLVRDLHPPQVSQHKQNEMKNLIAKVSNNRIEDLRKRVKENHSVRHDTDRSDGSKKYFSAAVLAKEQLGASAENLPKPKPKVRKPYKARVKRKSPLRYQFPKEEKE